MEAKSFEISQFSVSVNMSTFMAERMLAYSWLSSRPSHVMQLPWWAGEGERVQEGIREAMGTPREALRGPLESLKLLPGLLKSTFPTSGDSGCLFFS